MPPIISKILYVFLGIGIGVGIGLAFNAHAAFPSYQVGQGGTGSTTLTGLLKGNGANAIQTATPGTDYQAPVSATSPITVLSNVIACLAASGSQAGCLSSADWSSFNNRLSTTSLGLFDKGFFFSTTSADWWGSTKGYLTAITGTYPVQTSGNTVSLAFGTSSSNTWGGTQTFTNAPILGSLTGLIAGNSGATYAAATGTVAGSGLVSVTSGQSVIGTGLTVSLSNIAANTVVGNPTGASAAPSAFATSSLFAAGTPGQVLGYTNGAWAPMATATCAQITGSSGLCDGSDATASSTLLSDANTWLGIANFKATTTMATTTIALLNGEIVVDGVYYPQDEVGINRAFADRSTLGCGTVYIPAGDYLIDPNIIQLKNCVSVRGASDGATKLYLTNASINNSYIFIGTSVSDLTISNIFFSAAQLTPLGTVVDSDAIAIGLNIGDHIRVKNVRFEQFEVDLELTNISYSNFSHITDTTGNRSWGSKDMIASHALSSSTIDAMIGHCNDTCIRLQGARNILISNSIFFNGGVEIGNAEGYGPSQGVQLVNNKWWENRTGALNLQVFRDGPTEVVMLDGKPMGVLDITVSSNFFHLSSTSPAGAIAASNSLSSVSGVANVNITDNTMIADISSTVTKTGGVYSSNDHIYNWNVSNNIIGNMGDEGVRLLSAVNSKIVENTIYNFNRRKNADGAARAAGIYIGGTSATSSSNVRIADNIIDGGYNAGGNGIYVDDAANISSLFIEDNPIKNASTTVRFATTRPTGSLVNTRDISNSNFGIGTTSPYSAITVWGSGSLFEAVTLSSTTVFSIGQSGATTTNFRVSGTASTSKLYADGLTSCTGGSNALTWSGGTFGCSSIAGSGAAFGWTPTTNFGVTANATGTPIWFQAGLYASSTSHLGTTTTSLLNGIIIIDGGMYPRTGCGILRAIQNSNKQSIKIPPGTYEFASGCELSFGGKSIKLDGDTSSTTIFAANGVGGGIIYDYFGDDNLPANRPEIEISNIGFDLRNQSTLSAISMGSVRNLYIHDIAIRNGNGIWAVRVGGIGGTLGSETDNDIINSCIDGRIVYSTFQNITQGAAAVALFGYNRGMTIGYNNFVNNNVYSYYVQETDHSTVIGNKSYFASTTNSNGARVINSDNVDFIDNQYYGTEPTFGAGDVGVYDNSGSTFDGHRSTHRNSHDLNFIDEHFDGSFYGYKIPSQTGSDTSVAMTDILIDGATFGNQKWSIVQIGHASTTGMARIKIRNLTASSSKVFDTGLIAITGSTTNPALLNDIELDNNSVAVQSTGGSNSAGIYVSGASNVRILPSNNVAGSAKGTWANIQIDNSTTVFQSTISTTGFGLGTSTPSMLLSIHGNGLFSGSIFTANITATGTASTSKLFVDGLTSCNGPSNALTWSGGSFGCNTITSGAAFPFAPTTFGSTAANSTSTLTGFLSGIYSLASSTIGDGTQTGGLTVSGGATTTATSTLAGVIVASGNVGIGTTTPKFPLTVNGSVLIDPSNLYTGTQAIGKLNVLQISTDSSSQDIPTSVPTIDFRRQSGSLGTFIRLGNTSGFGGIGADNDYLALYADEAEKARFTALGVGIGTTTPTANLQVTTITANATTSVQFGKANQNKGTCMTLYDAAGSPVYAYIAAGASAFTLQNGGTAPAGCQN